MAEYELTFKLDPLTDEQEDAVYDATDAVVGVHGGTTLATITGDGCSATEAAKRAVTVLELHGAVVRRLYEDLVSRSMIAERAGVTPQAVGHWARGERQADFPEPFNHAAGGLWIWGEVNTWLGRRDLGDGLNHPYGIDYIHVNDWLSSRQAALAVGGWSSATTMQLPTTTKPSTAREAANHHLRLVAS